MGGGGEAVAARVPSGRPRPPRQERTRSAWARVSPWRPGRRLIPAASFWW